MTQTFPRRPLLKQLCDDLDAEGWGQPFKAWQVKGSVGDEYLVLVATFDQSPDGLLASMILKGPQPEDVTGLVVATEGWSYPPAFRESFSSLEALQAYRELIPPADHRDRIETRNLLLASRDASIMRMLHYRDETEDEWTFMAIAPNMYTGDSTIDAMRAALGLNEPFVGSLRAINDLGI